VSRAILRGGNTSNGVPLPDDLSRANLIEAELYGTDLSGANLSLTNLSNADLNNADLRATDLSGADLSLVNFNDANLNDADFSHTHMWGTVLGDLDIRVVKGLETVIHHGPSPLSINTLYLSHGTIPEVFVRGTGAPDSFIEYMRLLVARPIEYYTCFISYTSHDQAFAERLYTDLQSNNVRCWFAPHDLKIGDPFRERIDESIRTYDKLLLVLSTHSVASPWVEKEVETAFEKEHRTNRPVLFPVKLDESVMQTDHAWAADIRRQRHIGDFTRWQEHDAYQKVLTRLLRDLKAET
jgi:TIR domain/Pentapeptide repeats (8 copies)